MSCCTLEKAAVTITNVSLIDFFLDDVDMIPDYPLLFEKLRIRGRPRYRDSFALTLTRSAVGRGHKFVKIIREVVHELAKVCKTRDQQLNMTIKLFDEGRFYLYYVVQNNRIIDLTGKINGLMIATEAEALRHLGPRQSEPQDKLLIDEAVALIDKENGILNGVN
jgi:hypothetical protein